MIFSIHLKICSLERKSKSKWGSADLIKESFRNVSCFFVFGYLQVFLHEVIASASLDASAESSVAMKQAMVVSGMSHVIVKLFAPWVSWKVLPYSGKIALLFVLYAVAFLIIIVANSPASRLPGVVSFQRNGWKYVSFPRNFLWRRCRYQFCGRGRLRYRTRCPLLLRYVCRILLNANSFEKWNRVRDNGD